MGRRKQITQHRRPPLAAPPEKKPFEERLFSGAKIARVLESRFNVPMAQFVRDYDDDTSRSPRTRALETEELAAIQRFQKHKQIGQLANDLACSISTAQARITRWVLDGMPGA